MGRAVLTDLWLSLEPPPRGQGPGPPTRALPCRARISSRSRTHVGSKGHGWWALSHAAAETAAYAQARHLTTTPVGALMSRVSGWSRFVPASDEWLIDDAYGVLLTPSVRWMLHQQVSFHNPTAGERFRNALRSEGRRSQNPGDTQWAWTTGSPLTADSFHTIPVRPDTISRMLTVRAASGTHLKRPAGRFDVRPAAWLQIVFPVKPEPFIEWVARRVAAVPVG